MLQNKVGEQNLFKQLGRFSIVAIFSTFFTLLSANNGSFADFKKSQSHSFEHYKEENDRIFTDYLKSDWEAYTLKEPLYTYIEPKPRSIFSARRITTKKQGPRVNIKITKKQKDTKSISSKKMKNLASSKPLEEEKGLVFDFFGTPIILSIPEGIQQARFYPQTKEGITNYFKVVSLSSYESLLDIIKKKSKTLNLNDWGKYMLIKMMSENIFSNQDESRLLSWFLFNKLGYSVRIGLAGSHVVVMHYSEKTIYATPNYDIENRKFYVVSDYGKGSAGKVFTYKQDYPNSVLALDLSMESLPKFVNNSQEKSLSFKQNNEKYTIKYRYNQNLLDFMSTYPQADYETFFNTPLETETYRDIAIELKKHINAKQASVALNFVLNFVQNAFTYQVDSQQFGREKVMFAQEVLYYDKSDCEDRAILFSYLVKKLFNISVVGVKYKDHMSTALYIPVKGDSVKIKSKRYVIADPTYLNASIGQSMSKYKRKKPEGFIFISTQKD